MPTSRRAPPESTHPAAATCLVLPALLSLFCIDASQAQDLGKLRFSGDFRLRYEYTSEANGSPQTGKEVVRLRAGIAYPLNDWATVRARAATGSPDDPNSTDITLGQFVNDLAVSLDVASVELTRPHWALYGGKFANPFLTTELVWDGDVNPGGVAGRVMLGRTEAVTGSLTALYFVIDQQPNDLSSDMGGGQLAVSARAGSQWKLTAAGAYYDYRIRNLTAADAGDIRTNRLAPSGMAYRSDFDLLDAIVALDYSGFGERFPVRVVGDYVRNLAVDDGPDTAWWIDVFAGRLQGPGQVRGRYGYALVEIDAVLAAFAHDNTTIGSNSETHTLAMDVIPTKGFLLNATLYHFRPHEVAVGTDREFQTRLRLNATVAF
ncbi:MAG: putative porin [Gemmatimonadales bacterium]